MMSSFSSSSSSTTQLSLLNHMNKASAKYFLKGAVSFKDFFQEFLTAERVTLPLTNEVLKKREESHVFMEGLNVHSTESLSKLEEIVN